MVRNLTSDVAASIAHGGAFGGMDQLLRVDATTFLTISERAAPGGSGDDDDRCIDAVVFEATSDDEKALGPIRLTRRQEFRVPCCQKTHANHAAVVGEWVVANASDVLLLLRIQHARNGAPTHLAYEGELVAPGCRLLAASGTFSCRPTTSGGRSPFRWGFVEPTLACRPWFP